MRIKTGRFRHQNLMNCCCLSSKRTPPPQTKGKHVKIKYITQLKTHYPTFAFFCNMPQYIKEPYARFLENKLRENFNFTGVPIQMFFRQK